MPETRNRKSSTFGLVSTGVRLQILSFFRNPLNVALILLIPMVVIESYALVMEGVPSTFLDNIGGDVETKGRMSGAIFSSAFLTGLFGLFQAISSKEADKRLVLTGYPRTVLLADRLVTILGVSVLVGGISFISFSYSSSAGSPILAFVFLVLAGVVYGMLGVLIGSAISRELEGSLVLIFVADADAFFSGGLVITESPLPKLFPLYYPHALFESAVLDGGYEFSDLIYGFSYVVVLLAVVLVVFLRRTRVEEGWI